MQNLANLPSRRIGLKIVLVRLWWFGDQTYVSTTWSTFEIAV